jgi:hypothetical protein
MLLDKYLPKWDFTEVHTVQIKSSAEEAYKAMMETTMQELHAIVRLLFNLRSLPEKLAGRKENSLSSVAFLDNKSLINQMLKTNFIKLDEQQPHEIVFGLIVPGSIGHVWDKSSGQVLHFTDATEYLTFNKPDFLHVIANFSIEDAPGAGFVIVRTESRSKGLSEKARKNFRAYWFIIRPWSGLIRRLWLKAIKRRAESKTYESDYD